jgi:hypothetical protein
MGAAAAPSAYRRFGTWLRLENRPYMAPMLIAR